MFMVPILSGFIAVSIADRPGLVPGYDWWFILQPTEVFMEVKRVQGLWVESLLVF